MRRPRMRWASFGCVALACAALVYAALGGTLGCTAYATFKNLPAAPIDCSVENAYEFQSLNTFDTVGDEPFWASGDGTGGDALPKPTAVVEPLTDGARCGSTAALELVAAHNDTWGSLSGANNFGPRDASAFQGISFWARAPGNTTKSFTLLLADPNSYSANPTSAPPTPPTANCMNVPGADAGVGGSAPTITDSMGNILSSGTTTAPPPPDACGNYYATVMLVTGDWQLYTIPFSAFQQGATPNLVPNPALPVVGSAPGTALITTALMVLELRLPKEANMDLWIDNLAFYRPKGWAPPGRDGGVDAPQM